MSDTTTHTGRDGGASRRDFLKGVVITGGAAALGLGSAPVTAERAGADQSRPGPKGYQDTPHVRDY